MESANGSLNKPKTSQNIMIFIILTLIVSLSESRPKSWREGPIVDPGVFVITHIRDCRNGSGYCILGTNCSVDKDFIPDDLGGHCRGLASGFSPQASFVCCRQNPANFEDSEVDKLEAIIIEHNIDHTTSSVGDDSETTRIPTTTTKLLTESVTEKFNDISTDVIIEVEEVSQAVTAETTIEGSSTIKSILNNDADTIIDGIDVINTLEDMIIDRMDAMNTPEDMSIDRMDVMNTSEDMVIDRMDVMNTPEEYAELSDESWSGQQNVYPTSPQIHSPTYNGEGLGIPEVYEIEIGQTITQSESIPQVDILKPGLVIDDTESLVQSIVQSEFRDVQTNFKDSAYSNSPLSSVENTIPDYSKNENLKEQLIVDNLSNVSEVSYEMIGVGDAITNPEYDTNYVHEKFSDIVYGAHNDSDDHISDLNKHGTELDNKTTTEPSNENEYEPDCDFSIFWGISCSYPFDT